MSSHSLRFISYYVLKYLCFGERRGLAHDILFHSFELYIFLYYELVFNLKMDIYIYSRNM